MQKVEAVSIADMLKQPDGGTPAYLFSVSLSPFSLFSFFFLSLIVFTQASRFFWREEEGRPR